MKVEELIIDGFKSYATRTVISGWDSQFNAITGLNGSGKSNILDAICFVLGIASMTTVRASNLQDLIYKRGQAGVTKASVTIVFNNSEISKSPIGFESCSTISVTRQIILGGSSKYLINGHKAQQQTVLNLFQSVQLNINNPNFLIMQGKITKVLNMKPSEILSLIEEAAGTRTFEERKDKAQKTMAKKEAKLVEIRGLLNEEIEPKLEKLRSEKRIFLEFQQTQIDLENLSRVVAAYDYKTLSDRFTQHSKFLEEHESKMSELHLTTDKLNFEIQNLNEDLNGLKQKKEETLKKDSKLKELEQKENQLSTEFTRLNTTKDITLENLKEERLKLEQYQDQLNQLRSTLQKNEEIYKNHEIHYEKANQELNEIKDLFTKKEELLSSLVTGLSASGKSSAGYTAQLNEAKSRLNISENFIKTSNLTIQHLQQQVDGDKVKLAKAKEENEILLSSIQQYQAFIQDKESEIKLKFKGTEINELRDQEQNLLNQIRSIKQEINYMKREIGNLEFQYSRPSQNFDDNQVKGVVAQLFELPEASNDKAMALEVCAGGRLYNVVVDTAEAAAQLLQYGQLRKRVTIIPLDKVNSKSIDQNTQRKVRQITPDKADVAINFIQYDHDLQPAMQYIFGNTFVCNDPDTAKAVTFDPSIRARSITLEGDVYDPEGNLSGGSRKNNSATLIKLQRYNQLCLQLKILESQLHTIQDKIKNMDQLINSTKSLQNEINLKKHELSLLEKKLENNPSSLILKQNEAHESEIQQLQQSIEEHKAIYQSCQVEIQKIENDIKELNSDKGSKINELKKEVAQLKQQVDQKEKDLENQTDTFQAIQVESEQQKSEIANVNDLIKTTEANVNQLMISSEQQIKSNETIGNELQLVKAELDDVKAHLLGIDEEITELTNLIKQKSTSLNELNLEVQKLNHELEKSTSIMTTLQDKLNEIINQHEWILDDNVLQNLLQQHSNINLDESKERFKMLEDKFQSMRRKVNVNIMSMIDNVEKKESALKNMVKTIEKDKKKIVNTVDKLNGYKRDTLNTTYQKVSVDFGEIFADLLPGSLAKLVPVNMMDVTKGLEVKIKLGEVWKESLVELSGGQRSLIALSLIMALLQFKPAPMYILDEVDAALDLSHTQNIGHLIKTRFKGSQFIVVSLKEGMFTNANRVFRTRFQDGTSVVSVM
ncbi:unnamed protein product [Candida verbasci]|uniref:SMC hinge domain-containing protein n=1 Tax=Candida verbasci TaxID=1227364 RepID=A0A9W4TYT8_9ASCO|nr:unnamed protein product [Candida verbasci]